MQKHIALFILIIIPYLASADTYPFNKNINIKHYVFKLALNDSTDEIVGDAQITIQYKKAGIQSFRLDLVNQSAEKKGKGMKIDAVLLGNQPLSYTHLKDEVIIQLPMPSIADAEMSIHIQYHGIPFDGLRIGPTKFGDRSFFNENWPNRARHWLPTIDHPYDKATSEFIVLAPSHYKVVSNGLLLEESEMGNNTKLTHWKQSVPISSWLFVLGVADFAVQYVDQFMGKSIQTWVYAKNREAGFYDFNEPTKKVLTFLTDYVGPYAYEKLANIQSPSVSGGMETASAIFYAENLVNGKRDERTRNVVIHEIAHQWFGNAVTESTWDDAWLSEGFTTYFTLLFIENEYGIAEYNKGIQQAKKAVFDLSAKMPNFSIVSERTAEKELVTTGLTYQKGAWILHMLRELVGKENFKKGIREYYSTYYNSTATTSNFIQIMEKVSKQNLQTFFKQWLYQPINPVINIKWDYHKTQKKLNIHLTQAQVGNIVFNMPIEVNYYVIGDNTPKTIKINMNKTNQSYSFLVNGIVEKIELDPRNVLLSK